MKKSLLLDLPIPKKHLLKMDFKDRHSYLCSEGILVFA